MSAPPGPVPTAVETAAALREGRLTARRAVEHALARIAALDGTLRAFTVVRAEEALREADALDAAGAGGPLAGVPVAVKEEYDVEGLVTTLGGRGNSTPARADSEAIRRVRAAGAIVVGKTAMPEFGQFPHTESLATGRTHNPWDLTRSPGGSSGGSGVAVAAGMVPVALGADGGGSIRIPASCCGIVGLKPQRGRISPAPLREHWFALVSLGALTRTVADQALVLDVLQGSLPADRYRADPPERPFAEQARERRPLKVAWTVKPVMPFASVDQQIRDAIAALASRIEELGQRVDYLDVAWPAPTAAFLPQFYAGMAVEAGQVEHPAWLGPRTRSTVALSGWATAGVVRRALASGERVARRLDAILGDRDALLLPMLNELVPPLGLLDGMGTLRSQARSMPLVGNAAILNVSGHPGLCIPAGLSREGLPIGAQLIGRRGGEGTLLALAAALEEADSWEGLAPAYR